MQQYRHWRPTGSDPAGLGLEDRQEWLVAPVVLTRDSCRLDRSNWICQLRGLEAADPTGQDHEVHRFGHWACGWLEIVLVRPGSDADLDAEKTEAALAGYPVLDEEHHSTLELEDVCQAWEASSLAERVRLCQRHGVSVFAARRDSIPDDPGIWDELSLEY